MREKAKERERKVRQTETKNEKVKKKTCQFSTETGKKLDKTLVTACWMEQLVLHQNTIPNIKHRIYITVHHNANQQKVILNSFYFLIKWVITSPCCN